MGQKLNEYLEKHTALCVSFALIIFIVLSLILKLDDYPKYGFAGEIGNIATAVVESNVYGNTFGTESGPSAWAVPPVVFVYAAIFKVFGVDSYASYLSLLLLRSFILSFALYLLLKVNFQHFNRYKYILYGVFISYAVLLIIRKHPDDVTYAVFLSCLMIYSLDKLLNRKDGRVSILAILTAFIVSFYSLSFVLGYLTVIALSVFGLLKTPHTLSFKQAGILSCILLSGLVIWGTRNSLAMGKFIPSKSNLWFEAYISNVVDKDGLLRLSNLRMYHPMGDTVVLDRYTDKGEVEFIEDYEKQVKSYIRTHPQDFLKKIGNRLTAIFLKHESARDLVPASVHHFSTRDYEKLVNNRIVVGGDWTYLEYSDEQIRMELARLDLEDEATVYSDWKNKRKIALSMISNSSQNINTLNGYLLSVLGTFTLLFCLFVPAIRKTTVFKVSVILFFLNVLPYALVSFYSRYQLFQICYLILFAFFTTAYLLELLSKSLQKNPSASVSQS